MMRVDYTLGGGGKSSKGSGASPRLRHPSPSRADGEGPGKINPSPQALSIRSGTVAASLDTTALVLVNGGDGTEYGRKTLTGTLAAGAKLVIDVDPQNGAPDGLALVDTANDTLIDALSYEGAIPAATIDTKVFDLVEGTVLPVDVADSNTVEGTLARIPDGTDTNNAATDWSFTTTPTPGGGNVKTA